jgi:K319-like protein
MSKALYPLAILCMLLCVVGCKKDFEENKVPVADAGQPKTITLPDSAVVSGSGTDADGKVVAYLWSQVSGPANSTIVNPGANSTIIRFTVPGSYLFQFMVTDDNGATGVDTVSVLVTGSKIEGNKIPVANAGPNKTITLPDSAVVTGTGTDADGKVVAYLWSQVSGPASSTIVNPGAPSTSFQFTVAGSYIFQLLVVDDKGATGVDTMSVLVKPAVGQQTLTLQPANNPTEWTLALELNTNYTSIAQADIMAATWTRNSNLFTVRCLLKFDLSAIPANATIQSANLYLYSYPSPTLNGNFTDANYGSNNSMFVQQVTSNWSPGTLTWSNQPSASTTNQVSVPTTTQSQLDLNLDVTAMVSSMVSGNANYGFLMKLQNEQTYTSRIFVSSHNTTYTTKFPKLVVVYK